MRKDISCLLFYFFLVFLYLLPLPSLPTLPQAFVHALATPSQLSSLNLFLLFSSFLSLLLSIFLVGVLEGGGGGVITGNCTIMLLRILVSTYFIHHYFSKKHNKTQQKSIILSDFLPNWRVGGVGVGGWVGTGVGWELVVGMVGVGGLVRDVLHVGVGVVFFGVFLLVM